MKSIVRKRASLLCINKGKFLAVTLRDPHSEQTNYFVPGGKIEAGETPEEAAIRETLEETGYRVKIFGDAVFRQYPFEWAGQLYECHTWFYRGLLINDMQAVVDDASYNLGTAWLDVGGIDEYLGFNNDILQSIKKLLSQAVPGIGQNGDQ